MSSANREQVTIQKEKQFIWLEGEDSSSTVVQWNAHAEPPVAETATAAFIVNSYDYRSKQAIAVAAVVQGDKCSFYNCKFLGYQDTLCDFQGRHFFSQCWIEGGVDFIFGIAASVYEGCTLNSILIDEGPSWFNAHAKVNVSAPG
ncbi:Pectinesterase [Rhynchospora pubera]|uniref:pectinesterase n=1 Tax=Rhynchospora pubera TaxID=906938 RepID=A0AAV8EMP9_9POAL|nr:Pectinesterase [Rhynchospora pubera]